MEDKQFVGPNDNPDNGGGNPAAVVEQQPQKQEEQKPAVKYEDFDAVIGDLGDNIPVEEIQEAVKKVEEPKKIEEPKKVEEVKLETKPEEEKKEEVTQKKEVTPRDYSGIDESLVPVFKKMGNEFFNTLSPIAKENFKLKQSEQATKAEVEKLRKNAMPESYFEHPRGYTLTPEFEQVANTAIKAEAIVNHWRQQLDKVESGDTSYQEIHINPQTGEFYLSKPTTVDKETPKLLSNYVNAAEHQLSNVRNNLTNFATSSAAKYKEAVDNIVEFEKSSFGKFDTDEMKPIVRDTISKILPPVFQSSPLAGPLVKALLTINILGAKMAESQKSGTKPETNGKEQPKTKQNPTQSDMGGGKSDVKGSEESKDMTEIANALNETLGKNW